MAGGFVRTLCRTSPATEQNIVFAEPCAHTVTQPAPDTNKEGRLVIRTKMAARWRALEQSL